MAKFKPSAKAQNTMYLAKGSAKIARKWHKQKSKADLKAQKSLQKHEQSMLKAGTTKQARKLEEIKQRNLTSRHAATMAARTTTAKALAEAGSNTMVARYNSVISGNPNESEVEDQDKSGGSDESGQNSNYKPL